MIRLLSLLTLPSLVDGVETLAAKSFDRETSDKNRSLPFTLHWKKLRIAEMLFSISGENDVLENFWENVGALEIGQEL